MSQSKCEGERHVILKDGTCACESEWAKSRAGQVAVLRAVAVTEPEPEDLGGDGILDAFDYMQRPAGERLVIAIGKLDMGTDGGDA